MDVPSFDTEARLLGPGAGGETVLHRGSFEEMVLKLLVVPEADRDGMVIVTAGARLSVDDVEDMANRGAFRRR